MRRLYAGTLATIGMLLAVGSGTALADGRTDVILGGSKDHVDYHAESAASRPAPTEGGATIIGGNIQIKSARGSDTGLAGACDPDPRPAPLHPRPDDEGCSWAPPAGTGEDFISFGRTIQNDAPEDSGELASDTDTSPNGAFTPFATDTRERFNGRGGLNGSGDLFMEARPVLDDEDLNLRITGSAIFNYLSPQGNADNRWRRLCGEGTIEAFDKHLPIAAPFANDAGKTRAFVIQIWDADFKDPSDQDGGNQDYFIIDVYEAGTTFDVNSCVAEQPKPGCVVDCGGVVVNRGCVVNCTTSKPTPTPVAAVAPAGAVQGVRAVARGRARIAGARTCPTSSFSVRVTGRQIRRVTFTVDGKRVATVTRADRLGRWSARIDPRQLRTGTHRVVARVEFRRGAGPARTLRTSFRKCAPVQQVAPSFTG
jgi:hypothetical protein